MVLELKSFQGRITSCVTAVPPPGFNPALVAPWCSWVLLPASTAGGRSFLLWPGHLPEPAHCHRHTLVPAWERVGWLLRVTLFICSVNLQHRAVTVHFSGSLMFFLSIQFWLLLPGKCCAGLGLTDLGKISLL